MINPFCSKGSKLVSLEQSSHLKFRKWTKHIQYLVHCTTRDIIQSITTQSLIVIISWWLRALSKVCSGKNVQIMTRKLCELLPLAQPYHHDSSPQALQYHQGHHQEDLEYLWYYVVHRILGPSYRHHDHHLQQTFCEQSILAGSTLPSITNPMPSSLLAKCNHRHQFNRQNWPICPERDWHQRVSILWNSVVLLVCSEALVL